MKVLRDLTIRFKTDADGVIRGIRKVNENLDQTAKKSKEVEKISRTMGESLKASFKNISSAGLINIGSSMQRIGTKLTIATAPLNIALKNSFKNALNLDTAIRKVNTLNDAKILPTDQLKKNIREISDETGIMQEEISDGFYEALSSGIDSKQVTEFVQSGVKLTKAGFTTMATAIDATTTVLNAYGDKAYNVSKIHDIFVKTQDEGKITVDELASSIGRVIPTAAAAGVNLDQLGAAYSILTSKGQNAQIATTNLNSLLQELAATGSQSNKALVNSTGRSFKELMQNGKDIGWVLEQVQTEAKKANLELADMFGNANAQKAANSLFGSGFENMREIMQNATGTTDKNYKEMQGPEDEWKKTWNKIRNTGMDIAKDLMPLFQDLANIAKSVSEAYSKLSPAQKETVAKAIGAIAVGGPTLAAIGTVTKTVGGFFGLFKIFKGKSVVDAASTLTNAAGGLSSVAGAGSKATGALGGLGGVLSGLGAIVAGLSIGAGIYGAVSNVVTNRKKKAEEKRINNVIQHNGAKIHVPSSYQWPKSHKLGLTKVPYDNYLANLHEGERILTKEEARNYNTTSQTTHNTTTIAPNISITIKATENQSAMDIGRSVRNEIDDYFRNLRLQRV